MQDHDALINLIPEYAAGVLDAGQRRRVEEHLAGCAGCREELSFWMDTAAAVGAEDTALPAPPFPDRLVLSKTGSPGALILSVLRHAWLILSSQIFMVQKDIWPASATVLMVGYFFALASGEAGALRFLAPLVAAACITVIYAPDFDPVMELSLSTSTSPWQILLARLVLVFVYNLALGLAASLALLPFMPQLILSELIIGWLCPMAFLTALALLLSLPLGSYNAIGITYALWISQYLIKGSTSGSVLLPAPFSQIASFLQVYQAFWNNTLFLSLFSLVFVLAALYLSLIKRERFLHPA